MLGSFLLFGGPTYYAAGGWADFLGAFSTLEEASREGLRLCGLGDEVEWFQVVDASEGRLAFQGGSRYGDPIGDGPGRQPGYRSPDGAEGGSL